MLVPLLWQSHLLQIDSLGSLHKCHCLQRDVFHGRAQDLVLPGHQGVDPVGTVYRRLCFVARLTNSVHMDTKFPH